MTIIYFVDCIIFVKGYSRNIVSFLFNTSVKSVYNNIILMAYKGLERAFEK